MFQKGDYILYRSTGVCRVEEIGTPENVSTNTLYYFLAPIHGSGMIYIPVNSPVFMRPVISRDEALSLIASIPEIQENPNYSHDQKVLTQHYKELLERHDCSALLQLLKNIRKKTSVLHAHGKNAGKTDLQYKKQAEELLHEEFSIALDIPMEQVPSFIQEQLQAM